MRDKKCKVFTAVACVTGYCPDIPTEYDDREYSNGISCEECWFRTFRCEDCVFEGDKCCPRNGKGDKT